MSSGGGTGGEGTTPRAQPFYCPYCGEEDIRPAEDIGWNCRICLRTWDLKLLSTS